MINLDTSYGTFLQTFATPYQELNNIKGTGILNTERKMFKILANSIMKKSMAKECILQSINSCMH